MNLTLTILDWIIFAIVIGGSLSFGLYMAWRKKAGQNSSNFFLGGRSMKWPIVGASLFATNIGAEHLVGLSGDSYRYGLSAGSVELTTAITLGFACAILFPYYIKNKIFTIPEFLEIRYNRRARTFFSGLMLIISVMTKLAFTLFAGALVLNGILGWNIMTTVSLLELQLPFLPLSAGLLQLLTLMLSRWLS
jgi:solute:Na+ symporter, SSS family